MRSDVVLGILGFTAVSKISLYKDKETSSLSVWRDQVLAEGEEHKHQTT